MAQIVNPIFSVATNAFDASKFLFVAAFETRKLLEENFKNGTALLQIREKLTKHEKSVIHADAFTLSFLIASKFHLINDNDESEGIVSFNDLIMSQTRKGAFLNEKAIPRILNLSRLLNGGYVRHDNESAELETLCACIDALSQNNDGTQASIQNAMEDIVNSGKYNVKRHEMNARNVRGNFQWGNGAAGTQSSSALRALAVCGIAKKTNNIWHVTNKSGMGRLLDALNGKGWQGNTSEYEVKAEVIARSLNSLPDVIKCSTFAMFGVDYDSVMKARQEAHNAAGSVVMLSHEIKGTEAAQETLALIYDDNAASGKAAAKKATTRKRAAKKTDVSASV